jgi:quercetin dioxygenase-like cupin family protein
MRMDVSKEIKPLIKYSDNGILSNSILREGSMDVTLFCMSKGTEISDHTAKKSGFLYIIEGNGIFTLEGVKIEMLPGKFIPLKKDQVHSLKAKENTSFLLVLS